MKQEVYDRVYKQVKTVREMLTDAAASEPDHVSYRFKEGDAIRSVTTREFYDSVENLGASLTAYGLGSAHIACVAENCYPWIQSFLTALMSGGVFVPIDKELPADNIIFLLNDSDSEAVFCSAKYEKIFRERRNEMPSVRYFICFGLDEHDGDFLSFSKLIADGASLDRAEYDSFVTDENELKYLVYTSGTTGIAKGVMLTEHNIVSSVYNGLQLSRIFGTGLSVLPFNHTYEAVCEILVCIHCHITLCLNDSLRHVQKNMQLFKPTYIYLVPAFSEHFYNSIQTNVKKQGKEKTLARMIRISNRLRKLGIDMRRVFFKDILAGFGGNLEKIVCGGAPIRPEIGKFFGDIGISLTGGYGITECSPLVSVNDDRDNNYSSAGHRLPCLEWRIDSPDPDGIGEICIRGDVVMKGYYKKPELTAQAIRDGWFYTGDYGYINEKDEIVLTGRKKNIIVLNNGKNVYPEEIELTVSQALPYIKEIVVSGIRNEHGQDIALGAEIFIEEENFDTSAVPGEVKKVLAALPGYKQITKFSFRSEPFPKTTTNKIIRG